MQKQLLPGACIVAMGLVLGGYAYQHSRAFLHGASDDRYRLWMTALKGFGGTPRYVGNIGGESYFLAGEVLMSRFKAPTEKLRLPRTFPVGEGTPYPVTASMVPSYP